MDGQGTAVALLEGLLNRLLRLDPGAMERLGALHGRVILLEILGLGIRLYCVPGLDGLQLFAHSEAEPDCTLRGTPLGFARLGLGEQPADTLLAGGVEIRGDLDTGQRFGAMLGELDLDWEEQLSRLTGDLVAHQIGNQARVLGRWGRLSRDSLAEDVKEYLQEEARLLPTRWETEEFASDVDRLRDDVERLAARIERLQRQPASDADQP